MSEPLPRPVDRLLAPPIDELGEQRAWNGIEARRLAARSRPRASRVWLAGGALAAVACAALLLVWWRPLGTSPDGVARHHDVGPLRTASGDVLPSLVLVRGTGLRTLSLSDGSSVRLSKGARVRVLESTGTSFVTVLEAGRLDVHVRPRGPRRWVIECGAASVAVVGTRFSVERDRERVTVEVREGLVDVTPAGVGEAHVRLGAGESWAIPEDHPVADPPSEVVPAPAAAEPDTTSPAASGSRRGSLSPSDERGVARGERSEGSRRSSPSGDRDEGAPGTPPEASPAADTSSAPSSPTPPSRPTPAVEESDWQSLLAGGDARGAWTALTPAERNGILASGTAEQLVRLADAARLSGHPSDAARALETLLSRFPAHASAPLAAFTVGRLYLDRLGNPSRAAVAFQRALSLGVGSGLREDAMARLVEAHARAGRAADASAAAARYRQTFPAGRRRAIVDRWAPSTPAP
ncbi:MAG: FecR domain-containing protein [Deltaproteobacteria bacterium]|nr:FecR domain-containing protein [Deltaproteobacteria bacterium]